MPIIKEDRIIKAQFKGSTPIRTESGEAVHFGKQDRQKAKKVSRAILSDPNLLKAVENLAAVTGGSQRVLMLLIDAIEKLAAKPVVVNVPDHKSPRRWKVHATKYGDEYDITMEAT